MTLVSGRRQWTESGVVGRPPPVPVIALKPFNHWLVPQAVTSTTRTQSQATINSGSRQKVRNFSNDKSPMTDDKNPLEQSDAVICDRPFVIAPLSRSSHEECELHPAI